MLLPARLDELNADELRHLVQELAAEVSQQAALIGQKDHELNWRQAKIDKLTHELALHKRWRFSARSEQLSAEQARLFEETVDTDLAAIETELEQLSSPKPPDEKAKPRRQPLPPHLPRHDIHHEPEQRTCPCGCQLKRIGEDIAEKLDYTPGVFTVERHIRGKWVCAQCETLFQAPVPAQVIDKGIPTAGLLAHVMVAKFADHQPLYRLSGILDRSGMTIPPSTLGQWVGVTGVALQPLVDALKEALLERPVLHADETPVAMLNPGAGKTHRAYLWSYGTPVFETMKAVIYDFADSRAGKHAKAFLGDWRGTLVCDDYAAYNALFAHGITEAGCMAHARRRFFDLHANHQSQIAGEALEIFGQIYGVERDVADLTADERLRIRQAKARPIADALHTWLMTQRQRVPTGSATAKAIDYSLNRWVALTHYLDDGRVPIDNNWIENRIRPVALGRGNWLFAGSLRAGQRAAAIMSLIQSAKLNGHDPYAYLKDVLARLPTQPVSRISELLPHRWQPQSRAC
ncbi:IS66 family transposase [Aromatoleum diolicum]|uniref:IS66 family transposase n=1 Tax=Aromatoleum diolicum TaxID=75796 RepID=A0ABX1Q4N8_9RHOO|nr:IS66 family transposase [Aromatoleum diolicum]NMG73328.1 IS66 family transposase [Aromatoleum diolicum]